MSSKQNLVVTLHVEDDKRSSYIKVSINNTGEEVIKLIRTINDVKLVRFYDYTQDNCLFECRKNGFTIFDPAYESVIYEALEEFSMNSDKNVVEYVDILNFWMNEPYNNLVEISKIIKHYNFGIKTEYWIDKTS